MRAKGARTGSSRFIQSCLPFPALLEWRHSSAAAPVQHSVFQLDGILHRRKLVANNRCVGGRERRAAHGLWWVQKSMAQCCCLREARALSSMSLPATAFHQRTSAPLCCRRCSKPLVTRLWVVACNTTRSRIKSQRSAFHFRHHTATSAPQLLRAALPAMRLVCRSACLQAAPSLTCRTSAPPPRRVWPASCPP